MLGGWDIEVSGVDYTSNIIPVLYIFANNLGVTGEKQLTLAGHIKVTHLHT